MTTSRSTCSRSPLIPTMPRSACGGALPARALCGASRRRRRPDTRRALDARARPNSRAARASPGERAARASPGAWPRPSRCRARQRSRAPRRARRARARAAAEDRARARTSRIATPIMRRGPTWCARRRSSPGSRRPARARRTVPTRVYHYPSTTRSSRRSCSTCPTVWERRQEAVAAYESQFGAPGGDPSTELVAGARFLEMIAARARRYGAMVGVERGEPYVTVGPLLATGFPGSATTARRAIGRISRGLAQARHEVEQRQGRTAAERAGQHERRLDPDRRGHRRGQRERDGRQPDRDEPVEARDPPAQLAAGTRVCISVDQTTMPDGHRGAHDEAPAASAATAPT